MTNHLSLVCPPNPAGRRRHSQRREQQGGEKCEGGFHKRTSRVWGQRTVGQREITITSLEDEEARTRLALYEVGQPHWEPVPAQSGSVVSVPPATGRKVTSWSPKR